MGKILTRKRKSPQKSFRKFLSALLPIPFLFTGTAQGAVPSIPFTVTMNEPVTIGSCTGIACPYLSLNVGGATRSAYCPTVTNSTTLTCTYTATSGDLDLDGISFVDTNLHNNSISITDQNGNALTNFAFTPPANISAVKVDYPSLSFDFTNGATGRYTLNGTAYSSLSSFLSTIGGTFTRASIGTYFNSSGTMQTATSGTARFDYDPTTLSARGLLVEESRTNMATYSVGSGAGWQTGGGITATANAATAPDGTNTAVLLTTTTATNYHRNTITVTASTSYVFSFWAKRGTMTDTKYSVYNWSASSDIIAATSYYGQTNSSGWTRISVPFTTPAGCTSISIYPLRDSMVTGTAYVWGAQLEQGTYPTSYIPTTTSTATRAADVLTFPTGSWFNSTGTTIFGSFRGNSTNGAGTYRRIIGTVGATNANYGELSNTNTYIRLYNNSTSLDQASSSILTGETYATSSNSSGRSLSVHGATAVTDTATVPSFTSFALGSQNGTGNYLNGTIAKFKYYPLKTTDNQLKLLSQ